MCVCEVWGGGGGGGRICTAAAGAFSGTVNGDQVATVIVVVTIVIVCSVCVCMCVCIWACVCVCVYPSSLSLFQVIIPDFHLTREWALCCAFSANGQDIVAG